jgi:hypothetical protein
VAEKWEGRRPRPKNWSRRGEFVAIPSCESPKRIESESEAKRNSCEDRCVQKEHIASLLQQRGMFKKSICFINSLNNTDLLMSSGKLIHKIVIQLNFFLKT